MEGKLEVYLKVLVVFMEALMEMKNKEKGHGREGEDGGHQKGEEMKGKLIGFFLILVF